MRVIGQLPSEATANRFRDFLYVEGISNTVEQDRDQWLIWIHSEDELERAAGLFKRFLSNPDDRGVVEQAAKATAIRTQVDQDLGRERGAPVYLSRRDLMTSRPLLGPLTLALVMICIGVAVVSGIGADRKPIVNLFISEFVVKDMPEVRAGQVWRLITPIFIHFGAVHLILNMLALVYLGGMIEARLGTLRLAVMVVVLAVLSNLGENFYSASGFGGMSGVLFGLAGYVWMRGRFTPESGLHLDSRNAMMMAVFFVLCLTGVMGNIANVCHAVGLGTGLLWGYLSCLWVARRA